jgi:hypothetical protein
MVKAKKKTSSPTAATRIAKEIARMLFTSGHVCHIPERLVIVTKDGRDLGGWCENAVVDQVKLILDRHMKEA